MAEQRGEFPFDPLIGAKLFGEIQAEGLRAAGALVERLVHLVDGPHETSGADAEAEPAAVDMGAVLPWFDLWRDLLERTSDALQRWQAAGPSRIDIDGSLAPTHPLEIAVGPDATGHAEMWLHNGTDEDQGELVPQCGPLSDGYGNALECEVDINPPKIDKLHPRSSRGFDISITAGPSAAPGTYRGIVQVRGAERVWMPIEVVVDAPSS